MQLCSNGSSNGENNKKTIMFNFASTSLEEFEKKSKQAARLGATHVFVSQLPETNWYLKQDPTDPYPNWGMRIASLFKIIVPDILKEYLPLDYANSNLKLIKQRMNILKGLGLKGSMFIIEPFYLPEEFYKKHPSWRGPRCDHPRRTRNMYFSPCVDNPEVLEVYKQTMKELCTEIDLDYIRICTNDSGTGICWSDGLYNGPNGPTACKHIPVSDKIITFLNKLQEGADEADTDLILEVFSDIGFKEKDNIMDAMWNHLSENQTINGRGKTGKLFLANAVLAIDYQINPFKGLPFVYDFTEKYEKAMNSECSIVEIGMLDCDLNEYELIMDEFEKMPTNGICDRAMLIKRVAQRIAGDEHANDLAEAWHEIESAMYRLEDVHTDGFVLMGTLAHRWINRPFVPIPTELTHEEISYFRPYIFQALSEEVALKDMMNMQGMDFIKGFSGTRMATLTFKKAMAHIDNAVTLLSGIGDEEKYGKITKRLKVFICLLRNAYNAMKYQEIIDKTDYSLEPEFITEWPFDGDKRLLNMNEIARDEIDNIYLLIDLIKGEVNEYLPVANAPENEYAFVLGPNFEETLYKKIDIMLNHIMDAERRLYESNNK